MSSHVLMSFDVEEFDMPLEYHQEIDLSEQLEVGRRGLDSLLPLFDKYKIQTTLFTTANYANHFPDIIKMLAVQHEIASHTYFHSTFKNEDLLQSRITLEQITGSSVVGLRMPRMRAVEMDEVKKAGYLYDSSINPTYLPGRYNNLHLSRTIYKDDGMIRVPAGVSNTLRLPLFWLAFKNYPYSFFLSLCLKALKKDGYVCLYFHPWEFTDLKKYKLPWYAKNKDGQLLTDRIERLINDLGEKADFSTIRNYLSEIKYLHH